MSEDKSDFAGLVHDTILFGEPRELSATIRELKSINHELGNKVMKEQARRMRLIDELEKWSKLIVAGQDERELVGILNKYQVED